MVCTSANPQRLIRASALLPWSCSSRHRVDKVNPSRPSTNNELSLLGSEHSQKHGPNIHLPSFHFNLCWCHFRPIQSISKLFWPWRFWRLSSRSNSCRARKWRRNPGNIGCVHLVPSIPTQGARKSEPRRSWNGGKHWRHVRTVINVIAYN